VAGVVLDGDRGRCPDVSRLQDETAPNIAGGNGKVRGGRFQRGNVRLNGGQVRVDCGRAAQGRFDLLTDPLRPCVKPPRKPRSDCLLEAVEDAGP
jgi:hypothetical protein